MLLSLLLVLAHAAPVASADAGGVDPSGDPVLPVGFASGALDPAAKDPPSPVVLPVPVGVGDDGGTLSRATSEPATVGPTGPAGVPTPPAPGSAGTDLAPLLAKRPDLQGPQDVAWSPSGPAAPSGPVPSSSATGPDPEAAPDTPREPPEGPAIGVRDDGAASDASRGDPGSDPTGNEVGAPKTDSGPRAAAAPQVEVASPGAPSAWWSLAGVLVVAAWAVARAVPVVAGARLERHEVAGHPVRRRMLDHLAIHPGATVKMLAEASGVGFGRAAYHLAILERECLVRFRRIDRRRRFFLYGSPRLEDDEVTLHDLVRPGCHTERIVRDLRRAPGTTLSELGRLLGMSPGQTHYHVQKLEEGGLVYRVRAGRRVRHYLTSEGQSLGARVAAVGFTDGAVPA